MTDINTDILLIVTILAIALVVMGELFRVGVYFFLAIIPIMYILIMFNTFMFYAMGGLFIVWCAFRTFHPDRSQ